MSWHFSRALVADCLDLDSWTLRQCAQSRSTNIKGQFLPHDKTMEALLLFRFGVTLEPLELSSSNGSKSRVHSSSSQVDSLASSPQGQLEGATQQQTCGPKCCESLKRSNRDTYWQRTWMALLLSSSKLRQTLRRLVMVVRCSPYQHPQWEHPTIGRVTGLLPTPTRTANHARPV